MRIVKQVRPPSGLSRVLYRLPIRLYHLRLGRLLGHRLMLLHHTGRVSGKPRETVVEVVQREPDGGCVAASGFGAKADWYRNVLHTPAVTVETAGTTFAAMADVIPPDQAADIMADYALRHPRAARRLCRSLMGFEVDGSAGDFREVGRSIPFVRFRPLC